jgi:ABC-2 type transport system permease protein
MALDRHHAALIAGREYLENVRTRGFWLSLLLLPVILAVLSTAPILLSDTASESGYAVIDRSGWLNSALQRRVLRDDLDIVVAAISPSAQRTSSSRHWLTATREHTSYSSPVRLTSGWPIGGPRTPRERWQSTVGCQSADSAS